MAFLSEMLDRYVAQVRLLLAAAAIGVAVWPTGAKLPYIRRRSNWPISGGAPFPGCHGWLPGNGCPPKPALRAVRSAGNGDPARLGRGLLGQHNLQYTVFVLRGDAVLGDRLRQRELAVEGAHGPLALQ